MTDARRRLDAIRSQQTEIASHHIDELLAGRVSRREFVRRGSVIGLSAPLVGVILSACGNANSTAGSTSNTSTAPAKQGGTLRVASVTPAAAINPMTIADEGGLVMLQQTGEFLIYSNNRALRLDPMLATSWKPNHDASVWTFELRKGVTFHDGRAMTADDVVYTFKANCDPKSAANALSAFGGVLTPDGVQKAGPDDRALPPQGAQRELPLPRLLRQLQRHHRPQGDGLRVLAEDVHRDGSLQARAATSSSRTPTSWPTRSGGAGRPSSTAPPSPSTPTSRPRRWRCRAPRSMSSPSWCRPAPRRCSPARPTRSSSSRPPSTASCRCAPTKRRSTTPESARRWRCRSIARRWSLRCSSATARSATTRRSRRCSARRTPRSPSASRISPRPSSCSAPPAIPTASRRPCSPRTTRRSPSSPR